MPVFASSVYPVPNRFIGLGKEASPGTVTAATYTFPMTQFKPVDKVTYLEDAAWRNAMAGLYNLIEGVQIADLSMGGPVFLDGLGYLLVNICGDYYQQINGTPGSVTSLSGSVAVGATSIVVGSGTGITTNTVIQIGTGTAEEVRTVTGVAGGTLTLGSALYQDHASGGTVISYSAVTNYGHVFTLLNNGLGAGGWNKSQPATYTYEDYTGLPGSTGARQYAFTCLSEVTLTSEATALLMWDAKATALASEISAATPTTVLSAVQPQAAWPSTVEIGGAGTNTLAEWKLTLTRKLSPKYTNSGQQDPFTIARGDFVAMLNFNEDPAENEGIYLDYRNNTQPSVQLTASNGLTGSSAGTIIVAAQQAAFDTSELDDSKEVFGYQHSAKLVANTTDTGPSGGYSPVSVTIWNQVVSY